VQERSPTSAVLVISSQVARGAIGSRAAVFALERLGLPTWLVPTVWMPWHPGHGRSTRLVPDADAFAAALAEIAEAPAAAEIGTVVTGWFADTGQIEAAAALVERLRLVTPGLRLVVDPVLGDGHALYVPTDVAERLRDRLLPLADLATPNAFETGWLAGLPVGSTAEAIAAARTLAPPTVVVTSAPALMTRSIATLLVTADTAVQIEHPKIDGAAHGTGDLLTALVAGRLALGQTLEPAVTRAVTSVFEMVARSARAGADELVLAAEQDVLLHPMAQVSVRRIGEARSEARRPVARPTALE
jgi:pyridoxine kinase